MSTFSEDDMNYLKPEPIPEGNITKFNNFGLKPGIDKSPFSYNVQEERNIPNSTIPFNTQEESNQEINIDFNYKIVIIIISLILLKFDNKIIGSILYQANHWINDLFTTSNYEKMKYFNLSNLIVLIYLLLIKRLSYPVLGLLILLVIININEDIMIKDYNKYYNYLKQFDLLKYFSPLNYSLLITGLLVLFN